MLEFLLGIPLDLLIGALIGTLAGFIYRLYRSIKFNSQLTDFDNRMNREDILSIYHADRKFVKDEVSFLPPSSEFHISMPEDIKEKILEANEYFDNTHWQSTDDFLGSSEEEMLETLYDTLIISDNCTKDKLIELYNLSKTEIAELFLSKIEQNSYFNGYMVGIRNINIDNKNRKVIIDTYKSDYYTHRVMASLYKKLIDLKYINKPDLNSINKYYYFLTSMGMDALVIIKSEKIIPLGIRSAQLINMDKDRVHLTMNEAVSRTDMEQDNSKPSMQICLFRGLKEELNLNIENYDASFGFSDLFMLKDPLEFGICAFVAIKDSKFSRNMFELCYSSAKDREFETAGLDFVEDKASSIRKYMENKNDKQMTKALEYVLGIYELRKRNFKLSTEKAESSD